MRIPSATWRASPNYSDRHGNKPVAVVAHGTGAGSTNGTVAWLTSVTSRVSAHFLIGRDGELIQFVDTDHAAWHAGAGRFAMGSTIYTNPNRFTIGIELANHGLLYKTQSDFNYEIGGSLRTYKQAGKPIWGSMQFPGGGTVAGYFEPYYAPQLQALRDLLIGIGQRGGPTYLIGHDEIAIPEGRKCDPYPTFPWVAFGRKDRTILSLVDDLPVSYQ